MECFKLIFLFLGFSSNLLEISVFSTSDCLNNLMDILIIIECNLGSLPRDWIVVCVRRNEMKISPQKRLVAKCFGRFRIKTGKLKIHEMKLKDNKGWKAERISFIVIVELRLQPYAGEIWKSDATR